MDNNRAIFFLLGGLAAGAIFTDAFEEKRLFKFGDQKVASVLKSKSESISATSSSETSTEKTSELTSTIENAEAVTVPEQDVNALDTSLPKERIANIEALLQHPNDDQEGKISEEVRKLTESVSASDEARKEVLDRFLKSPNSDVGAVLGSVLSSTNDPEVENALSQFAVESKKVQQRVAALNVISQMSKVQHSTLSRILEALANSPSTDESLTMASLSTLTRRGAVSEEQQQEVLKTVEQQLQSGSATVRAKSLQLMADWLPNLPAKELLRATNDPDAAVRSIAVQLLGQGGSVLEARQTIVDKLVDTGEDMQVRVSAWRALEGFPLDHRAYEAYQDFGKVHGTETEFTN